MTRTTLLSLMGPGFAILLALAGAPVRAQDFTAGKTPAQLFNSDCSECHRTPNGLAKRRGLNDLATFLREHYTTKLETAGALAAYVAGYANAGPADSRNRAGGLAAPGTNDRGPADRRATGGDEARTAARSADDPTGRRRRTTNLSGDGEKRRDGEPSRQGGATAPPTRTAARTGESLPREATDPLARLRSYLSEGLGSEGAIAEAAKVRPPKSRRRQGQETVQAPPETPAVVSAPTRTSADMPALMVPPSPAAASPADASAPPPAAAPPPAPAPTAVVTPPRLGQ